ncbi:peroxiredoxin-like family protein [Streptomyces dubilierae]|uniref:thioredoxin-dependent peroxiredoxin n=1 Tax=Streptomyces dubilierae TaxID=3075533 RepID=A0ABU2P1P4_9ACTN|nr:peroxiredoxin-like family protein [Streptomyces sp. DSM 41921]MDT0386063.1 peroxiredoxin-like family protein [Streptomyces sp. DSM 41921]
MATTPIADQVAQLNEVMAAQAPAEVLEEFRSEQAGLDAAGVPSGVAEAGTLLPDVELLDAHGDATTLMRTLAGRPAVIVFYRGAWCPYCNVALRTYQRELSAELEARGVALIAVSPQKPDGSLTVTETNQLTYAVLSDSGNRIGRALGIVTRPVEAVRRVQQAGGLDLTEVNADSTADIVMPTVALVDPAGVLRWIDVHPNYTMRTEPAQVLAAVKEHLV